MPSYPNRLILKDANDYNVLLNALEALADSLESDDEDQAVIDRLVAKLEALS